MIFSILAALFAASTLYALILNIPAVQEWYIPDRTWVTVVIGNSFILLAMAGLWATGEISLSALLIFGGGNIAAGTPIVIWQLYQAVQRHQEQEAKRKA